MSGFIGASQKKNGVINKFTSQGITDNANANAVTIAADESVLFNETVTLSSDLVPSTALSNRNMIINGGMQVSQRNGTSSFALTNGTFGTDRWKYNGDSSRLTAQQVADAPAGFYYSLKLASVGNNSPGTTTGSGMWMQLEGDDVTRLSYGTASAKTVTLSFWVKSSIAGNFGGAFSNGAMNRAYPFTFPVTTSWNRVSITIAGDTTGTWVTSGNGYGLRVILNSASGSNFNASSAGAWVGYDRRDVSGTVQLEATSGATLNITGVQLEEGSTATPFEHRSYGDELARCLRYYWRFYNPTNNGAYGMAQRYAADNARVPIPLPLPMRIAPTAVETTGTASHYGAWNATSTNYDLTNIPTFANSSVRIVNLNLTVNGYLGTAGFATLFTAKGTTSYLGFSAEL